MPIISGGSGGGSGGGAMALLQSAALASNGPTLSVSGIAGGYHALLVILGKIQSTNAAVSDVFQMVFNSDTTAAHYGAGNSNSSMGVQMGGFTDHIKTPMPGTSAGINQGGGMTMWIPNYTDTVNQIGFHGTQTGRVATGGTTGDFPAAYFAGIWAGGSALTTITCSWATGPNFVAGAFIRVFGIT